MNRNSGLVCIGAEVDQPRTMGGAALASWGTDAQQAGMRALGRLAAIRRDKPRLRPEQVAPYCRRVEGVRNRLRRVAERRRQQEESRMLAQVMMARLMRMPMLGVAIPNPRAWWYRA